MTYSIDTSHHSPNHEPRNARVSMLVIHATVGSYESSLSWLCSPVSKASTHYLIRKDGYIAQLVADHRAAWHAGRSAWHGQIDLNECSIGVELENANTGRDPYPPAQLAAAHWLCQSLIATYNIERADVVRHLDIAIPRGRKSDPAGLPWPDFADSLYLDAPRHYHVLGLPVYERSDRTGPLWGHLAHGEVVTIDDPSNGHLADGRGFVDLNGLEAL
jgi:N-acetylmuramoyl-L-alanine amidase